jgi:hypothetical protein
VNDAIASIARLRGKVITLLVICGTIVSLVHKETATTIFPAISLAAGALAGMEAWAAKGGAE